MRRRTALVLSLAALVLAACGGDDSAEPTATSVEPAELELTIGTSDHEIAGIRNDLRGYTVDVCGWGETPRFQVADGSDTVLATGDFDVNNVLSMDNGEQLAIGAVMAPPDRCELTATTELTETPDILIIEVSGRTWDILGGLADGNDWSSETTVSANEIVVGVEIELTRDDLI